MSNQSTNLQKRTDDKTRKAGLNKCVNRFVERLIWFFSGRSVTTATSGGYSVKPLSTAGSSAFIKKTERKKK